MGERGVGRGRLLKARKRTMSEGCAVNNGIRAGSVDEFLFKKRLIEP